jgi:Protein of unknown function (DUF1573)
MKLRSLFVAFFSCCILMSLSAQTTAKVSAKSIKKPVRTAQKFAKAQFDETHFDWGTVKEDTIFYKDFTFKNTGNKELVILDARGSCGCTQPQYPDTPILPGETGKIRVRYVAKNKVGPQKPIITLTTNGTPEVIRLFLEGWVHQIPGGVN